MNDEPSPGSRPGVKVAPESSNPLAHPDQAVARRAVARAHRRPGAIIIDRDLELALAVVDRDPASRASGRA